ncbi:MAG TPA: hypothetical protein VL053_20360, partial [Arachidicoccus sp.]|nr:hypothetical protein [Arachidicoccus sp.]
MKIMQRRQRSIFEHVMCTLILFFLVQTTYAQKGLDLTYINTVRDSAGHIPSGYVPPLISNGSLNMLIDFQGGQEQKKYVGMTPGIFWAGRRPVAAKGELISFGYFGQELKIDGQQYKNPS